MPSVRFFAACLLSAISINVEAQSTPAVDFHVHLLSPAGARVLKTQGVDIKPIDAADVIKLLDKAGIQQAVILSDAYFFDSPSQASRPDSYRQVMAENDWTARQVSRFPKRLIGFCSVNPVSDHALAEVHRCAGNSSFKGLKLHLDESGVDLLNSRHVARARAVFKAANAGKLAVITHIGTGQLPPYSARHARIFVDSLASAAPDVSVIVAHLWGGAGYDADVMKVFAQAAAEHRNLYFEVSGAALRVESGSAVASEIAGYMRRIGMQRFFFGSDFPDLHGARYETVWRTYKSNMPLTAREFGIIAANKPVLLRY